MSNFGIDNSIGWAHWQLRGWKTVLGSTLAYAGVIVGLIIFTIQMNGTRQMGNVFSGWRIALVVIQGAVLVLFGGSRVAAAVRSDLTSRMIESHRLMPVPPLTAISGYLWGPPIQAISLGLATFVIGGFLTMAGGLDVRAWLGPNFVLATFAVFCWIIAAFSSFIAKSAWSVFFIILMVVTTSQGLLLVFLPALAVLFSPLIGSTAFRARAMTYEFDWPMLVSFIGQACVAAILYVGAARKYRRSEDSALAILPGLLLLACWVALSVIGLTHVEEFQGRVIPLRQMEGAQVPIYVASMVTSLLLAMVPVANAARDRLSTRISPLLALACAAIASFIAMTPIAEPHRSQQVVITAAVVSACMLVSTCYLLKIIYRVFPRGWVLASIWIGITCLAPIIFDCGAWMLGQSDENFLMTGISAFSPIGALAMSVDSAWSDLLGGLIGQAILAFGWALLFYVSGRRRKVAAGFSI